jgi:tetratricopeptide (TPR) repeat protein
LISAASAALPFLLARPESIASAGRALAARAGGWGAGFFDHLTLAAWELGGWMVADLARAAAVFLAGALPLLLLLAIFRRSRGGLRFAAGALLVPGACALFAWGAWQSIPALTHRVEATRLLLPVDLFEAAGRTSGRILVNPSAYPSALLCLGEAADRLPPPGDLAELCASPVQWRAGDRNDPFGAVVLVGNPVGAESLLEMLSSLGGWRLARIDNHGVLYVKGSGPPARAAMPEGIDHPRDRSIWLAQAAIIHDFAERPGEAAGLMDEALESAPREPEVLTRAAMLAASQKRWGEARGFARRSLDARSDSLQARYLLALSLLESGAASSAATESRVLFNKAPSNPKVLQLHARISREVNDPSSEIEALDRLLDMEQAAGRPAGLLHILLGQAWARRGFAARSIEHYEAALRDNLDPAVREEVIEALSVVRSNALPGEQP